MIKFWRRKIEKLQNQKQRSRQGVLRKENNVCQYEDQMVIGGKILWYQDIAQEQLT